MDGGLTSLPEGFTVESPKDYDPLTPLIASGVRVTNGFRTPADTERLRRAGYTPAQHSLHLQGDAVDLAPAPGMTLRDTIRLAQQHFGSDASISIHNGTHVHVSQPGWGGAPHDTLPEGFTVGAPASPSDAPAPTDASSVPTTPAPSDGLSELPEGFTAIELPKADAATQREHIDAPKPIDFSADLAPVADTKSVVKSGQNYRVEGDTSAEGMINTLLHHGVPYADAQRQVSERFPQYGKFGQSEYDQNLAYLKTHPHYNKGMASVEKRVALTPEETSDNETAQSTGGAALGNYANAATAGVPVLLAGQKGNDFEKVSFDEHPVASVAGGLVGGVAGALMGGGLAKGVLAPIAEGESFAAPAARAAMASPVGVQVGVDTAMGSSYGAATAGPGHRLEGAAIGAGATLGLEGLARGVIAPAFRQLKPSEFGVAPAVEEVAGTGTKRAAMAVEGEASPEISGDLPPGATIEGGAGDGSRVPLTPTRSYRTPEEMAAAAESVDPKDAIPQSPPAADRVGNIDLSRVETAQDVSHLLKQTEEAFGFDQARRGVHSQEETVKLADDLGMTTEQLLSRREGQALNAEQALAARNILAKSSEELSVLAERAANNGGAEDLAAFRRGLLLHASIQEQVTGATAEAGRALNQFKYTARASAIRGDVLKAMIEGAGGENNLTDLAETILRLKDDPAALNDFARRAWKPQFKDKLTELYYASMLSGPQTHAANMVGNTMAMILQPIEYGTASAIGGARALARRAFGRQTEDRVLLSEVGARATGILQGTKEGMIAFGKALKTGETSDAITKIEGQAHEAIGGVTGKIVRAPMRALTAEDELFKSIARRMDVNAQAVRMARGEGLRGAAAKARIAELSANPTDKMLSKSMEYARYMTFQNKLGKTGTALQGLTNQIPMLKLFMPFVRTPTNIFKFAIERSPLAAVTPKFYRALKAGGAQRDLALAKISLGTGLSMAAYKWAEEGHITGNGPSDPNAKRLLQAQGWQPFSIKVGDTYYSYSRLDPVGTIMGVAADLAEKQSHMTDIQASDTAALLVGSIVHNLENKTFLSGLSDAFGALDALSKGQSAQAKVYLQNRVAGIVVPAIAGQIAQTIDPIQRSVGQDSFLKGTGDAIEARIPFASRNVEPQRNILGDPVMRGGGLGPDFASPIKTSNDKHDADIQAIQDTGAKVGKIGRRVGQEKLTDAQFDKYQELAGRLTRQYIREERTHPDWATMDGEERKKAIESAKKDARKEARAAILPEKPE